MVAALGQGGTSFDALYVNVNGESGYFDRSLHAYGREGEPCERCGTPMRRVAFMNRSSYFCPVCQPGAARPPESRPTAPGRRFRDPSHAFDPSLPARSAPSQARDCSQNDHRATRWDSRETARLVGRTPDPEGYLMAKALIGYMNSDLRSPTRLAAENARLRARG